MIFKIYIMRLRLIKPYGSGVNLKVIIESPNEKLD